MANIYATKEQNVTLAKYLFNKGVRSGQAKATLSAFKIPYQSHGINFKYWQIDAELANIANASARPTASQTDLRLSSAIERIKTCTTIKQVRAILSEAGL